MKIFFCLFNKIGNRSTDELTFWKAADEFQIFTYGGFIIQEFENFVHFIVVEQFCEDVRSGQSFFYKDFQKYAIVETEFFAWMLYVRSIIIL